MVGCAEGLAEREIIFPEMAALAIGMWVVDKRVWHCNKWKMLLAMSLCSVTGVLIVRYSPFPLLGNIALAFSFAAIHLTLSRTTLIPQVSAIILPILLKTDSWVYPAAVIIMSLIIILGQYLMEKKQLRTPIEYIPVKIYWRPVLLSWTFLLFTVLSVASLAIYTNNIYFILPPLIVTYIEFAHSKAGFRNRPVQILLTLFAASLLGSLCQWFGYYQWHLPEFLIALCITGPLFLLFELSGKPFAPAGAVALIPLLL
ncbi:HPP family protein, partial [Culturomica massiliensis]|uniref:HPP family protein n=2 Tax=Culturomica massiliensis TaxID=1841857 RepID=UPI00266F5B78